MGYLDLETIESDWDQAARGDALFNIVTLADKADGGWTYEDFYSHGQVEIDGMMRHLEGLGLAGKGEGRNRALDFGCGAGRLTTALARYFKRVDGVDISYEMIQLARANLPDGLGCRYWHNTKPDLKLFKARTFDFVYSMIVFQHMPQDIQQRYVAEIVRVLRTTGVAMIEIPDGPDMPHHQRWLSMHGVTEQTVRDWVGDAGGSVVDVFMVGDDSAWKQNVYTITKEA